jgi:hypothetical protein
VNAAERGVAPDVTLLLALIDEAYDRKAWHGPNLRGSIRGVSERDASQRPAPGRHNVWELVVHAAYWKYAVWRRLTAGTRGTFPLEGSNWFERPARGRKWRDDVALLDEQHRRLRRAVAGLETSALRGRAAKSGQGAARLAWGIAAHDIYHAGQIRLIKTLLRGKSRNR